jgi:hypothetical protein
MFRKSTFSSTTKSEQTMKGGHYPPDDEGVQIHGGHSTRPERVEFRIKGFRKISFQTVQLMRIEQFP